MSAQIWPDLGEALKAMEAEAVCHGAQQLAGSAAFSRAHPLNRLAQDARAITLMGPPNYLCRELVTGRRLRDTVR